jgi:hypothetical protein
MWSKPLRISTQAAGRTGTRPHVQLKICRSLATAWGYKNLVGMDDFLVKLLAGWGRR